MLVLYVGSYLMIPLGIPALLKLFLVMAFTFIGAFAIYEFILRRVRFLRPLFGVKAL